MKTLLVFLGLLFSLPAAAQSYPVEVLRVIDGDTFAVRITVWIGVEVRTEIRVLGIDTPELKGKCPAERDLANRAKIRATEILKSGKVSLEKPQTDKYGGRIDARVLVNGQDYGATLIQEGLAVAYNGEGPRKEWCAK